MVKSLKHRLEKIIRTILDGLIEEELQKRGIPTREEWEGIQHRQKMQEALFRVAHVRAQQEQKKIIVPPSILVEEQRCSLCANPHFQGGLCLFHFHQRYRFSEQKG